MRLWFILLALGVGPGDEVITTPGTFMATAEAISYCGAKPVFVDIEETRQSIRRRSRRRLRRRPKQSCRFIFSANVPIWTLSGSGREHGLPVVEDACQAHGAEYKGRKAGSLGVAAALVFIRAKIWAAFGEAGGVLPSRRDVARKMMTLRDHGQAKKYHHSMIGWNGRMDGIQGAVLRIKLKNIDCGNEARRAHAKLYDSLLNGTPNLSVVKPSARGQSVYISMSFG